MEKEDLIHKRVTKESMVLMLQKKKENFAMNDSKKTPNIELYRKRGSYTLNNDKEAIQPDSVMSPQRVIGENFVLTQTNCCLHRDMRLCTECTASITELCSCSMKSKLQVNDRMDHSN